MDFMKLSEEAIVSLAVVVQNAFFKSAMGDEDALADGLKELSFVRDREGNLVCTNTPKVFVPNLDSDEKSEESDG